MSVIRNKLRAKDGASIFMGLMYLLVALMVGAIVLTASTASAGKMAEMKQNEQDYLTVASAARLVRDRICALKYTYKTLNDNHNPPLTNEIKDSDGKGVILENELKNLYGGLAGVPSAPSFGTEKTFEITGTGEDWDKVHGSLKMMNDGKIIVELWLEDQEGNNRRNSMKIEFLADGPVTETYLHVYEVPTGEFYEDEEGNKIPIYETKTDVYKTTTCSWPESGCTITKGL